MQNSVNSQKKVDGSNVSIQEEINAKFKELKEKWHRQKGHDDGV